MTSAWAFNRTIQNGTTTNYNPSETQYSYVWYDSAKAGVTTHYQDVHNRGTNDRDTTTHSYNTTGHLASAVISDGQPRTVSYTNDLSGQVLKRDITTSGNDVREVHYRFGGQEMGHVGNDGTRNVDAESAISKRTQSGTGIFRSGATYGASTADFDQNYTALNSYQPGSAAGGYTVRSGDSLQSIASNLWGDSSLWYKLAQANGLSGESALIAGTSLRLPAGVTRNTYNASTFKPYDPGAAIGETAPTAPEPPKNGKSNDCGALGSILLVVVAVAMTLATQGAASTFFAGAFGASAGATTGAAVVAGNIAGGVVAAAAGSIASQAVGVATGIQDKFSLKDVGLAALSGGVGAGLRGVIKGAGALASAARGAAGSALSQGIGVATGLQQNFSWAGVAAAGVGGGVSGQIGDSLGTGFGGKLARSSASAIANAATRSAIDGTNFDDNLLAAIPDVIGQAIGNEIGGAIVGGRASAQVIANPVNRQEVAGAVTYGGSPAGIDEVVSYGSRSTVDTASIAALMNRVNSSIDGLWGRRNVSISDINTVRPTSISNSQFNLGLGGLSTPFRLDGYQSPFMSDDAALGFYNTYASLPVGDEILLGGAAIRGGVDLVTSYGSYTKGAVALYKSLLTGNGFTDGSKALGSSIFNTLKAGVSNSHLLLTDGGRAIIGSNLYNYVSGEFRADQIAAGQAIAQNGFGTLSGLNAGYQMDFTGGLAFDTLTAPISGLAFKGIRSVGYVDNFASPSFGRLTTDIDIMNKNTYIIDVHGNSKYSLKNNSLYKLTDDSGNFLKYGITSNKNLTSRYATSFMKDKQIFKVDTGSRSEMLTLERLLVSQGPGPLNLEPWAKAARTSGK